MKKIFIALFVSFGFTHFAVAQSNPAEIAEVEAFLDNHEVDRVTSYCIVGKLNCRSVVQYKDKTTGAPVATFEDRFLVSTAERSVASRAFFLEKPNGKFKVYAQDNYKNEVDINNINQLNQDVSITFDSDNFPEFTLVFFIVGTTDTLTATLNYSANTAVFTGDINGVWIVKP